MASHTKSFSQIRHKKLMLGVTGSARIVLTYFKWSDVVRSEGLLLADVSGEVDAEGNVWPRDHL